MFWTPGTNVTFNRRHKETLDCDKLKPLVHLGGSYYLALADTTLRIKNKTEELLPLSPLSISHFPCDIHLFGQQTGLGSCPPTLKIHLPILTRDSFSYIPWTTNEDMAVFQLHYNSLQIPLPVKFDQNTTDALNKTCTILDNRVSDETTDIKVKIIEIKEEKSTLINDILTYIAFTLTWIDTAFTVIFHKMRKLPKP